MTFYDQYKQLADYGFAEMASNLKIALIISSLISTLDSDASCVTTWRDNHTWDDVNLI